MITKLGNQKLERKIIKVLKDHKIAYGEDLAKTLKELFIKKLREKKKINLDECECEFCVHEIVNGACIKHHDND